MTPELLIKAISDIGIVAVFIWLVIMFQRGEIISRVILDRIISEMTSKTIAEISARLIATVEAQMKLHQDEMQTEHNEILEKLSASNQRATDMGRNVQDLRDNSRRSR